MRWMTWAKLVGGRDRQIRSSVNAEKRWGAARPEASDATLPRKTSKESGGRPYRNPTQVVKERILRRSSEAMRRNSAN